MADEPVDDGLKFVIEGKEYAFDDFELGELEWLEDELDGDILQALRERPMRASVRFLYVIKHRENPEFTLEDARKLKLTIFDEVEHQNGNGNGATSDPPTKPRRSTRAKSGATS
jgi:hypothetical protein